MLRTSAPLPPQNSVAPYEKNWKDYRRIRLFLVLMIVGWFPFVGAVIALGDVFRTWIEESDGLVVVMALLPFAYMILIGILLSELAFWRCPRCRKVFKGFWGFWPGPYCRYCDLPKFATSPDTES